MAPAQTSSMPEQPLGWEGWQIALPAAWNPIHFSGTARTGRVIVADLERERLDLSWRRVRSVDGVDLARLAGQNRKDKRHWKVMDGLPVGEVFSQGRCCEMDEGGRIALLVSRVSRRLLFVRLAAEAGDLESGQAERILASLDDRSAQDTIPWCVYGFSWQVPSGFQRSAHTFQTGHLSVRFRRGLGENLVYERNTMGPRGAGACENGTPAGTSLEHRGHRVFVCDGGASSMWSRWLGRGVSTATWQCDTARRQFVVSARGRQAAERVRQAVEGVTCH